MSPSVSIIVPHYNDLENLLICIESVCRQRGFGAACELLIVDNNSSVDISAALQKLGSRGRILTITERGAHAARNGGVAEARGEVLAFIDSDCVAGPGWLEHGLKALNSADIVTGRINVTVESSACLTGAEAFERVFAFDNQRYVEQENFAATASLFVRKSDFERVGGFRPNVSEDKEWCWRAARHGLKLRYFEDVVISHPARRSWAELKRKWQRLGEQTYFLAQEKPGGRLRWWLRSLLLPVSIGPAALQILRSSKLDRFSDRMKALAILAAIRLYRFTQSQKLMLAPPSRSQS